MKTSRFAIGGALLAALCAHEAHGDGTSGKDPVEVVVTGTRTPESAQRSTVKTDVVTREEAERRGATNVAEALATQPGVQVNPGAYGYLGGVSAIQIQGFDLNRVLVLEDGEPVIGAVGGAIDLASIPLADIERIEIITGPTSALYGSSAIGGVVNIVTGPPREIGPSARARAEYRSHNGVVLDGAAAYRKPAAWAEMDLGLTRQDGVTEEKGLPDLTLPKSLRTLIGVRAGVRLADNADLQVRARWMHQAVDGLESKVYPGLGRYLDDLPGATDRFAVHLLDTLRFGKGSSLHFSLARQWASAVDSTVPQGSPLSQSQRSHETLQSFEAIATIADGDRTWVFGARFEAEALDQDLEQVSRVGGKLITSDESEVVPTGLSNGALYAQLAWKFGKVLTILPGIRGEYHGTYGGVVAPRLAVAFRPVEAFTLRVSAGRGFRTPSAEELGFDFDHSIYGYKVVGNADLKPESSWGVNADVTWSPDTQVSMRAGAFVNWVNDLIDIDLGAGKSSGSVVTYTYENFEKVRTFGAQASVVYKIDDWFKASASYDYLWTHDDINDVPLSGRPPHTVTFSIEADLPWKLQGTARAHFVTDAYVDDTVRSPGYSTVDLRAGRTLWPESQLYLGCTNLFDVHQDRSRVGDLRPLAGRVLYAGLSAGFPWEKK